MQKVTDSDQAAAIFERERPRLLAALGAITAGGVVERIQLIGSSSVPGLAGSGGVDIGLAVWPFPVDEAALEKLGYQPMRGEPEMPGVQRFADAGGQVQLWAASLESTFMEQAPLISEYLRHSEQARQNFQLKQPASRAEKEAYFQRILPGAQHWWVETYGFSPLEKITAELPEDGEAQAGGFSWWVSSGWALDLFLGQVTRVHRDVDIVVPFSQQIALQARLLERGWTLQTPLNGKLEPWPRHMQIQLPRHQVQARRGDDFIDLLLTEIEHGIWRYRREPVIVRSTERMGLKSAGGIPYLAPELVLLFKSKNTGRMERPQDQLDFEQALPHLEPERRAWLRWAITASDPGHPWVGGLKDP